MITGADSFSGFRFHFFFISSHFLLYWAVCNGVWQRKIGVGACDTVPLSRVHSDRSQLVHHVLIQFLIDLHRFWQMYSKDTYLLFNWSKSWIIWKTNIKKNKDKVRANQFVQANTVYTLHTMWQDNRRAGMQVHSVDRSVSVCVCLVKIMRLNLPVSFFPVYNHYGHVA